MSTFKKPLAGDPANLILSQSFQGALVDVVNAYNRGELTQKPQDLRKQNVVMVKNQTDDDIEPGQALSVDQTMPAGSADLLVSYLNNPLVYGSALTWHSNIAEFAIATQTIEAGLIGPASFKPWGRVKADINGAGDWLMHDPATPAQFKRSTGGVARVITADAATGQCVANFDEQQRLWRYQLTENVSNLIGIGNLIDLGGNVYAANTSIRFTNSTKLAGDAGFCVHTGNYFDAIESAATIASAPTPRFRFRLKTDFDDTGVATAYVLDVFGNVTNPDGSPVELGDILTVHDPRKCFAHAVGADSLATIHAEADAFLPAGGSIGYAVKTEQLKATPNEPDDDQYPRWEVEQCTQTVQRMKVQIEGSLNSTAGVNETQPTGELAEASKRLFFNAPEAVLSRWPDVDYAPEWTPSTAQGYDWEIQVTNPHRFSAGDGWAIIERVVNRSRVEDASNVDTPYTANNPGTVEWQIVEVEKPIARWHQVKYGGASEGWTPADIVAEGEDPVTVSYKFDDMGALAGHVREAPGLSSGCLNDDEIGWAFWDPNEQYYNVIVTESALLGAPVTIQPVATGPNSTQPLAEFSGCDLILRQLGPVQVFGGKDNCQFSQSDFTATASLTSVDVITSAAMNPSDATQLCFQTSTIYVCETGTGPPVQNCVDVCDPCEPTGCCEYPPGTYTDGVTEAACQAQGGTWTAGDCPGDDCFGCSFCDTPGGGVTITLQQFSFDPGGSVSQGGLFTLSSMTQTSGCTALATGYFTPLGGGTQTPATCTMTLQSDGSSPSGYSIRCVWSPSQVYGCTLDADLYSGAQVPQPDPCSDVYGYAAGGVNPTNPPEGNFWTAYEAATAPCTP